MRRLLTYIFLFVLPFSPKAQTDLPESLQKVKEKIESVEKASGQVTLNLDIDFINMPEKQADIKYVKGKPVEYESDNFIFIPRKGLDFSWNSLFQYQFISVDRGTEIVNGKPIQTLNIIPDDKRADFAIMTLGIDIEQHQIISAEISTKKEGTFNLRFEYQDLSALPSYVEASFEMEKVKIPLNFMGSDTDIDRKSMRSQGAKTGKVFLELNWKEISTQ